MLRLLEADLPEVHGAFRLPLFAIVQGQSQFARHQSSPLRRPAVCRRGAAMAQDGGSGRRPWGPGGWGAGGMDLVQMVRFDPQRILFYPASGTSVFRPVTDLRWKPDRVFAWRNAGPLRHAAKERSLVTRIGGPKSGCIRSGARNEGQPGLCQSRQQRGMEPHTEDSLKGTVVETGEPEHGRGARVAR